MTDKEKQKILADMNTEDFNTMRDMLSEIEMKIMQVDSLKQKEFYQPIQRMIYEAWLDACNPNDSFLFPTNQLNNGQ
jgi:hypothetical protein